MVEFLVLAGFTASLFICIGFGLSLIFALVTGFFLFFGYGLYKKHSVREMLSLALSGIRTVKDILLTFVLIGVITALWRSGGTIAYIVYHATRFCDPRAMVLVSFLLCCLISALTGTAFGTAATMGVICVTMANGMGIPVLYTGGAVLAGCYFGDRCSPMSTSALLVSTITHTDLFRNIVSMVKSSVLPFVLSCAIYTLAGLGLHTRGDSSGIRQIFSEAFVLEPVVLIPAVLIIVLSLFKVKVKLTMSLSILCAAAISLLVQKLPAAELLRTAVLGYSPANAQVRTILAGGGILSMAKVLVIVFLSSSYSGMFNGTGLLDSLQEGLQRVSHKLGPFTAVLISSVLAAMISCNQTLTIMLTHQLCGKIDESPESEAAYLENTAVVIPALIPWSIASQTTLGSVNAPLICILTAFYLYLLPICNFITDHHRHKARI